jgi:hypothetical protein
VKAWIDVAVELLEKQGPMEIPALVESVQKVKPLGKPENRLGHRSFRQNESFPGQRIFRLARQNEKNLAVTEYPSFRLKSTTRPSGFPNSGRLAEGYKVLFGVRRYLDVRDVAEKARSVSTRPIVSDCPEYWMYEALTNEPRVFEQRGSLKIGLARTEKTRGLAPTPKPTSQTGKRHAVADPVKRRTDSGADSDPGSLQSFHEAHVESVLAENPGVIEAGLTLIRRQYPAPPVGRIDLLCKDKNRNHVVIELKRAGATTMSIIDQVTRYMGWVKMNLASRGGVVRGIIIVNSPDEKLTYSAMAIPHLETKCFSLSIKNF